MYRAALLTLVSFVLIVPSPAHAQDEVLSDEWVVVKMLGKPVGYGHETTTRTTLDGRPARLTTSEERMAKGSGENRSIDETTTETWTTEDGEFLKVRKVEREGEQEERLFAERVGDEIRVRRELNDGRRETKVAIPPGTKVYSGLEGDVLARLGLEVGKKHTVTAFSNLSGTLSTETAEVGGRRPVESLGRQVDAFVVKATSSEMPGLTATVLCDGDGSLLSLTAGPLEIVRATREEALATLETGGFDEGLSSLPLDGGIPSWPTLDSVIVAVTVGGSDADDPPLFVDDEYQSVSGPAGRFRLELHPLRAPEKAVERLPIEPRSPEWKCYAEPALLVQSDAPEIRAEAERILAGDRDPLSAARKLCHEVFVRLKKEKVAASTASALETLRAGAGDCTEHAVLFCALARAAGLPAREAHGVTLRAHDAGYHAWAEVLIDGAWVPVDATIDAVGLPPAYIRLGTSEGNGYGAAGLSAVARLMGRTELAVVSATRRGTTFDPRDPEQRARQEGEVWRDLAGDYTVDLSGGWRLQSAKAPNTVFRSPAGEAIVVTVAEALIRTEQDWADFERGFASSIKSPLESQGKSVEDGQAVRVYRYAMDRNGQQFAGCLRVRSAGPVLYCVNAITQADAAKPDAFRKLLERVKIRDAGR